jgi:hypothetical protein
VLGSLLVAAAVLGVLAAVGHRAAQNRAQLLGPESIRNTAAQQACLGLGLFDVDWKMRDNPPVSFSRGAIDVDLKAFIPIDVQNANAAAKSDGHWSALAQDTRRLEAALKMHDDGKASSALAAALDLCGLTP